MKVNFTNNSKIDHPHPLSAFSAGDNGNLTKEVNMPKHVFTNGMPPDKRLLYIRVIIRTLLFLLAIVLIVGFGQLVFNIALPFLLALFIAWLFNPLLKRLTNNYKVRRILTIILLFVTYLIIGAILWYLGIEAVKEINNMITNLPSYLENIIQYISDYISSKSNSTILFAAGKKIDIDTTTVINYLSGLFSDQLSVISSSIMSAISGLAVSITNIVIFLFTLIIASYFVTSGYPQLTNKFNDYLGNEIVFERNRLIKILKDSIVEYLQALLIIALVVAIINYIGFVILDIKYAVLLALFMGFLDFLPVLGSGAVLVPWIIICFAIGDYHRAIGLLIVYGVVFVAHRIMEPKIIGQTSGISPLLTLLGIYAGFIIGGFSGMIVGPFIMILLFNTFRAGIFTSGFKELKIATYDLYCFLRGREIKS